MKSKPMINSPISRIASCPLGTLPFSSRPIKSSKLLIQDIINPKFLHKIKFYSESIPMCVGFIDLVNSTQISLSLSGENFMRFYQITLNIIAKILHRFDATIIKNNGDGFLFCFPSNQPDLFDHKIPLECSLAILENQEMICKVLEVDGLPPISYRISLDYGPVHIVNTDVPTSVDLMGNTVNICSKINHMSDNDGLVIGSNLYRNVISDFDYDIKESGQFVLKGLSYPVYSVERTTNFSFYYLDKCNKN